MPNDNITVNESPFLCKYYKTHTTEGKKRWSETIKQKCVSAHILGFLYFKSVASQTSISARLIARTHSCPTIIDPLFVTSIQYTRSIRRKRDDFTNLHRQRASVTQLSGH